MIRNIWEEVKKEENVNPENVPLIILKEQAKFMNEDLKLYNIIATVERIYESETINHVLYLNCGENYKYNLIKLCQNLDNFYPCELCAYQDSDVVGRFPVNDEKDMYKSLKEIFKNERINILLGQLKNI